MLNKCPCQAEILNKWPWPPKSWTFPFSKNDFHVFHGFFSDIWPEITHKSRIFTRTYAGRFQKSRTNEKCRTNKKSWTNGLAKLKRSDAQKMSSIRISRLGAQPARTASTMLAISICILTTASQQGPIILYTTRPCKAMIAMEVKNT